MKFLTTDLPGVILIEPDVYSDSRGFFLESYHERKYREGGIDAVFVQDNHSRSLKNTLRGLHAQVAKPQGKLVRVIEGAVLDVAVDIRRGSPSFGNYVASVLSAENFRQLYIPPGYAHGFCVTSAVAEFEYKCTDFYEPRGEITVAWNDPDIGIPWPVREPLLSEKDRKGRRLRDLGDELPAYEAAGGRN